MSFAAELAGSDPMRRIAERVLAYWNRTYEYRLVQALIGVLLSNVANDNSDMVVDISAATSSNPVTVSGTQYTSPNFTRDAVIDAAGTIGDRMSICVGLSKAVGNAYGHAEASYLESDG